jgi:glycerol-3-phosphate cytidylyltransferase
MIVGFTCSAFDLLHAGHLLMLEECKKYCDYLIVGLHVDPSLEREEKNKPIQTLVERYIQLKACKHVDEIIPYETEGDLEDILSMKDIQCRFIGSDYIDKEITGQDICEEREIKIIYTSRDHTLSSSVLRKRIFDAESGIFRQRRSH